MERGPENPSRRSFLQGVGALGAAAVAGAVFPRGAQEGAHATEEKEDFTAREHWEWFRRELKNCNSDVVRALGHGCGTYKTPAKSQVEKAFRGMANITKFAQDGSMPIFPESELERREAITTFQNTQDGHITGNATQLHVRDPRTGRLRNIVVSVRHAVETFSKEEQAAWVHDPHQDISVKVLPEEGAAQGVPFNLELTQKDIFGRYGVVYGVDNPGGESSHASIVHKRYGSAVIDANPQLLEMLYSKGYRFNNAAHINNTFRNSPSLITLPSEELDRDHDEDRYPVAGMSGSGFYVYDESQNLFQFAGMFFAGHRCAVSPAYTATIGFVCSPEQVSAAIIHALHQADSILTHATEPHTNLSTPTHRNRKKK